MVPVTGPAGGARRGGTALAEGVGGSFLLTSALPTAILAALVAWLASKVDWSFVSTLDFSIVYTYRVALLQGLLTTLWITSSSLVLGLVLGILFACLAYVPFAPL